MESASISVVITTCNRLAKLRRTLASLSTCRLPPGLVEILIAENGVRSGAQELLGEAL